VLLVGTPVLAVGKETGQREEQVVGSGTLMGGSVPMSVALLAEAENDEGAWEGVGEEVLVGVGMGVQGVTTELGAEVVVVPGEGEEEDGGRLRVVGLSVVIGGVHVEVKEVVGGVHVQVGDVADGVE
jgi:hypothetical protein